MGLTAISLPDSHCRVPVFTEGKDPPVQNGMVEIFLERLYDCRQKLQTRGCTGEFRCGGRGGIHEEYGEFL